jgi:glutamine synthetase
MHTNFSTKATRDSQSGFLAIELAINELSARHNEHIAVYGEGLAERLTGQHETCSIDEFRQGVADRGASVRIPLHVAAQGFGYLEDRRPAANADPYMVSARLLETICVAPRRARNNGATGQGRKSFWKTGSLSPFQQPTAGLDEPLSGDFIGE